MHRRDESASPTFRQASSPSDFSLLHRTSSSSSAGERSQLTQSISPSSANGHTSQMGRSSGEGMSRMQPGTPADVEGHPGPSYGPVHGGTFDSHAEPVSSRRLIRDIGINVALVLSWYFFSTSISVYNKWMFSEVDTESTAADPSAAPAVKKVFPFPLFTTSFHMFIQFGLAALVMQLFPRFKPSFRPQRSEQEGFLLSSVKDGEFSQDSDEVEDTSRPIMSKRFYLTHITPCGAMTGLDIGLGNTSLRFITLTFYTMCKSSVLGFTLLFAFLFGLEKPTYRLCGIVTLMTAGVFLMAIGETEFSGIGFFLIMTAACSSGLRWSLTKLLLDQHPATSNPFSSILYLSPVMFVTLFTLAIIFEGPLALLDGLSTFMGSFGILTGAGALLFPGFLAFCMTASEFAFLKRTSVVSLSIAGIFKEVVTFVAAYLVFHDTLTAANLLGVVITIIAIIAYNIMKYENVIAGISFFKRRSQSYPE